MIAITHWDADGIFCLYLLYKKFGTDINVYFSGPRRIENTLIKAIKENDKSDCIIITDIGATQEAIYLSSYFKRAIWIDHHQWDNLERTSRVEIIVKPYKSASRVLSEYLNVETELLDFIDDIDSNNIKSEEEERFRDLISAIRHCYPRSYHIWFKEIANMLYIGKTVKEILNSYESILTKFYEYLSKVEDEIILNSKIIESDKKAVIVDLKHNIPAYYVTKILSKRMKTNFDYIVIFYDHRAEIRTQTGKNVLEIAKQMGGGGHREAAGFDVKDKNYVIKLIEKIVKNSTSTDK